MSTDSHLGNALPHAPQHLRKAKTNLVLVLWHHSSRIAEHALLVGGGWWLARHVQTLKLFENMNRNVEQRLFSDGRKRMGVSE